MTGIIDRLERDELVQRKKDKEDGRKTCIWLTRKAKRLYERIMPLVQAEYSEMQDEFSDKRWDDLYDSLFHLIKLNSKTLHNN
jgi:DNA-binding MarR family transcriptional regulator